MYKGSQVIWNGDGDRHSDLRGYQGVVDNVVGDEALVKFNVTGTPLEISGGHKIRCVTCWCPVKGLNETSFRIPEWQS